MRRPAVRDVAISLAAFSAVGIAAFRLFFVYGKSLVWAPDGVAQHYPSLYFFNLWIRRFVYHPEQGLPLWSWTIGMGADIISTLSFHVVGDPFALVSLAFPMAGMEYAYAAAYVLRILFAGLFSLLYFRRMGARTLPALAGSILYVFVSFLFFSTTRHPFFANALVFLPLLLMGVENALAKHRSWTLAAAVFVAAVGNFYFFYMLTIITVLYAVARYFEIAEKAERWTRLAVTAARVGGLYLLGIMFATPVLLPTMLAILNTARGQGDYQQTAFYPLWEFRSMARALAAGTIGPNSTFLGFGYLGLVLVPVLFMRPGRIALKFMVVAYGFFVSLPLFGSLFNGMTFPSNRFAFSWGIFLALAMALVLSDDCHFTRREILAMCAGFGAYVATVLIVLQPVGVMVLVPMAFGVLTISAFAFEWWRERRRPPRNQDVNVGRVPPEWRNSAVRWVVVALLAVNVVTNATAFTDVRFGDTLSAHVDKGRVLRKYAGSVGGLAKKLPEEGFYRAQASDSVGGNSAMVLKFRSTSFYFSIMSRYLTDLKKEIANPTGWSSFAFDGFDDRTGMTALTGTEYYLASNSAMEFVPFGFERYASSKTGVAYRSRYALPLGFVYDSVMPRAQYESLSALDKQSAMLQSAVVEDGDAPNVSKVAFEREAVEVTYTVGSSEGVSLDATAGLLVRTKDRSYVQLAIEKFPQAELYVELNEFDSRIQPPAEREAQELGPNPTPAEVTAFRLAARDFHQPTRLSIFFSAAGRGKTVGWNTPESPYYWGDHSKLVNLGYQERGADSVRISAQGIGTISFESLKVWVLPMTGFPKRIEKLRREPLKLSASTGNVVKGTFSSAGDGVLFLSIPYSSGWSATVDGRPVEVLRVNTAFSGIPVTAGEHEVEMRYFTPGLKAGLALAGLAALISLVLVIVGQRRAGRRRKA